MAPENNNSQDELSQNLRQRLSEGSGNSGGAASPPGGAAGASPGAGEGVLFQRYDLGTPGLAQMAAFCRQLSTLVSVGIPLVQCLRTLSQRIEHTKLKRTVGQVTRSVEGGKSFSEALGEHPKTFSSMVVNVVRVGEEGGILEGSLIHLAELMERRYELRRRVSSAMAYPVFALCVCALAILIILGFAIPVFKEVYGNQDLPATTEFVMGLSSFVQRFWWLLIILVVGAVGALKWMLKSSRDFARAWDRMILSLPIVKVISVKVNVTRTARTMANLLSAGIPMLEALRITAETSENLAVADMLDNTRDNIEKGGQLEKPLRDEGLFPDLVVDMLAIGDEAGRLDLMFEKIAETYDADVDHHIRMFNAILEPALIVILGGTVLLLALAVLQPYWELMKNLQM